VAAPCRNKNALMLFALFKNSASSPFELMPRIVYKHRKATRKLSFVVKFVRSK